VQGSQYGSDLSNQARLSIGYEVWVITNDHGSGQFAA
jgi:hypothetical protein